MIKVNWLKINSLLEKKDWYVIKNRVKVWIHQLPRSLFIKHSHLIDVIAVGIGLAVTTYLVLVLVFKPPEGIDMQRAQKWDLAVDTLKSLNGWAADRQKEKERRIELIRSGVFKIPSNN